MSSCMGLPRLETRLYFHTPCFERAEIAQVLRLVLHFPDLRIVMQHVTNQRALFPNQTAILAVLQAEYENQEKGEKNGKEKTKQSPEENPYARARRLNYENGIKESFSKSIPKADWKKVKSVIDNFQGRIIAVTRIINQGEGNTKVQSEVGTVEKIGPQIGALDIKTLQQNRPDKPKDRTRRKKTSG